MRTGTQPAPLAHLRSCRAAAFHAKSTRFRPLPAVSTRRHACPAPEPASPTIQQPARPSAALLGFMFSRGLPSACRVLQTLLRQSKARHQRTARHALAVLTAVAWATPFVARAGSLRRWDRQRARPARQTPRRAPMAQFQTQRAVTARRASRAARAPQCAVGEASGRRRATRRRHAAHARRALFRPFSARRRSTTASRARRARFSLFVRLFYALALRPRLTTLT